MTKDNRQLPDRVRFLYTKSDDYKNIYANGARGGIGTQADFIFDLYQERSLFPDEETRELLDAQGKLGGTTSVLPQEVQIVRESRVEIVMTIDKAEVLANWILERIKEYKENKQQ